MAQKYSLAENRAALASQPPHSEGGRGPGLGARTPGGKHGDSGAAVNVGQGWVLAFLFFFSFACGHLVSYK